MGVDWSAMKMVCSQEFWKMAVLWTLSLLYSYFLLFFARFFPSFSRTSSFYPRCRFSPESAESKIKRPICIVTGATSGLGAAAASAFVAEGYHVILVGRCSQLLDQKIQEIKQKHRDAYLTAFQVFNSTTLFMMMETNYISAFVLTNLLLPLLKNSPVPSRIVNVTSFTHRSVSGVEVDRKSLICLPTSGKYTFAHIYGYSKLCLLLFSYELHRQLHTMDSSSIISVNAADPGAVETRIMRELPRCLSLLAFMVLRCLCLLQPSEDGVASVLDAALAPPEASGKYFFGGKGRTIESSSISYNAKLAADLWSTSNVLFQEFLQMKG